MDFRFNRSPGYYTVEADTMKLNTNYFLGFLMGIDGGYELFRLHKHELNLLCGLGWESIGALSTADITKYSLTSDAGTLNSLNLNAGLGYQFFYNHKLKKSYEVFSYISLEGKYNFLFFNNNGGSDLRGGAWIFSLNYGYYTRKVRHNYLAFSN